MESIVKEKFNNLSEKEKKYDYINAELTSGFCFDCFVKQDKDFKDLMCLIKDNIEYFNKDFIEIFRNSLLNQLEGIESKINSVENINVRISLENLYKLEIKKIQENFGISSLAEYINTYPNYYFEDLNSPFAKDYPYVMNEKYLKEYKPFYSIVGILFEDYKKKSTLFIDFEKIGNIKKQLIDIYSPINYIDKYNLLKFSNFHRLYVLYTEKCHIFDTEKQISFYSGYIPDIIFEVIKDLIEKKYLNDLSFLITDIGNNIDLEERDYGRVFSYDLKELPEISSFYDENLIDNKLIVKRQIKDSKISLTFETLKYDFISQDEQIITNLIHLEIETIDDEEFITHLDHEFIFYTLDEYEKKVNKHSNKGFKKVKTFKIDNSRIPLKYSYKNTNILIYFIMELLDNKELIAEYFSKIQESL
ncbi:hypothetical protein ACNSOL_12215 (plasmid) [Aliarcobacter lanthieri]|uniref:hypothetical protein n=1 Tax=Aliarcobacter lanthieri TaxID=1355374 RepID=UPI003AAE18E9